MASNKNIDQKPQAPAEGERRAMTGYLPQYELAAWSIMRHLREQTLEAVRLGDPNAGRVDDFIVLSSNAVDGHSVKWSEHRATITFNDLVKPREKAPCWIAQLADGWKLLSTDYPMRRVTVHLVTCDIPSQGDECPGPNKESFASFYYEAWLPFQNDGRTVPDEWKPAWKELQRSSGLTADEFAQFAKACRLDFHARTAADRTTISQDDALLSKQLKAMAAELANIVRDPARQVEFSKDELLKRLAWSHLVEFKHRHDFPTRDPYEPIDSTVGELATKLGTLKGGYLVLLGSPGSGKSTLLTRTLEAGLAKHRLVKYYAFVPGSADPRTRGESVNFLHDLVLSLERAGFSAGQSQGEFDRSLLLERLHKQLQMLGNDFAKSGVPTIILVDGLDHIPREQNPQHSLIGDLPLPDQLLDGVYFVLGSQTDDLPGLPPAVLQSIREPGRKIQMAGMSKEAVLKVIAATKLPAALTQEQQERVVTLAGGHPLALSLLLNRLKTSQDADQVAAALADAIAFTGDVDRYYFAYWQQIEANHSLAELVGLLARLRRPIDLDWVATWNPTPPLAALRRRFGHFFREERSDHWVFFHNSFRQYVLSKSATLKGGTPEAADRDYHRQLAAICEASSVPHAWEVVYHLATAGEAARVLALATPEYFRKQLYALRPLESIRRDARYVAMAAGQRKDASALVTMTLFLSELSQRAFSLDAWRIGGFLLSLGYLDNAFEYLWEGNELQINDAAALRVARTLFVQGDEPLARRVFEAAEPFSLIQPAGQGEEEFDRDTSDLLQRWAEAAPLFRPVGEVIELIKGFVPPKAKWGETPDPDQWRANLFYWAADSMESLGRTTDAASSVKCLSELEGDVPYLSVWLLIHRFRAHVAKGKVAEAKVIVEHLVGLPAVPSFSDHAKLVIAQAALSILGDQATAAGILKTVKQPEVSLDADEEPSFSDTMEYFRFYRLLMTTGKDVLPNMVVPDPAKLEDWPRVLLGRSLVHLAKVSADAARGKFYTGADVRANLHHPLRLYLRTIKERRRWHSWNRVERLRDDFERLLVEAVQEHGPAAVEELRAEYEKLWADKDTAWAWPPSARRSVVMSLYDAGVSAEWTRAQLDAISKTMLEGKDVSGKVDECEAQAKAWRTLGDGDAAVSELKRLVSVSFGVGYRKDYQMDEWVEWLEGVLPLDPGKVGERISLFAAAIAATEETTEGRGTQSAALSLIKSYVSVSPRRAVALVRWFEKYGCVNHASAVATLLQTAAEKKLCRASTLKAAYLHLLLAFATGTHVELAQAILTACSDGVSRVDAASACRQLVDAVNTRALATSRPFILRGLKETAQALGLSLPDCGLDALPPAPTKEGEYEHTLKLKDGTILNEEEALARASSVDGLLALINEHAEGYYRWDTLSIALLPKLSRPEVVKLVQGLPADFDGSLSLSAISRRLSELGERQLGWQIAERALKASPTYGWAKYADGGTRLEALKALVTAIPIAGRDRAIREVAANLSSESGTPYDLARCLNDIVPLLGENMKPEAFYPLVEEYVKLLSAPLHLLGDATAALGSAPDDDNVERALCDLLASHMVEVVPLVSQGAMKTMARLVLNGSPPAERCIKAMVAGNEFEQVAAVLLLEVVAAKSVDALKPYGEELRRLVLARNWWTSKTAERLCKELKLDDLPERPFVSLSPHYELMLPPSDDKMPIAEPDEPLPDSDNSRDLLRPYDHELGFMAEMTGLDEENLFASAANEMKRIASASELTAQSEKDFRYRLERSGLKLPFRRRRGAIAREAMRRIASDLIDGRRVHPENVSVLLGLVRFSDPRLALVEPSERPPQVKALDGLDKHHSRVEEWAASSTPSFALHLREVDGRGVLAEVTKLKARDWSVPMETRVSLVGEKALRTLDEEQPFERVFDTLAESYGDSAPLRHRREHLVAANPLIVRNQWLGSDTDGADWIALNPQVGKKLGWTLSPDGLFRWVNAAGEVMVETVWWKDGCVELPPYERESEVAEGFVVLASPAAASEILKLLQEPTRYLMVQRSCVADHQVLHAPAVQTTEPVVPPSITA